MIHPVHRISCLGQDLVYAINDSIYRYHGGQVEVVYQAEIITEVERKKNIESRTVQVLVTDESRIAWASDDKVLRMFNLSDSRKKSVDLVKRCSALALHADGILIADKFGDVYDLLDETLSGPILGHVSMITSVLKVRDSIVTADRDEHIRVSQYPKAYNISAYCLGSTQAVTSLAVLGTDSNMLLSGGGDSWLGVWTMDGLLKRKIEVEESGMVIKLLAVPETSWTVVMMDQKAAIYCFDTSNDDKFTIPLSAEVHDIAIEKSQVWVALDTTTQESNFASFELDLKQKSYTPVDLSTLNKQSAVKTDTIRIMPHHADLMPKQKDKIDANHR